MGNCWAMDYNNEGKVAGKPTAARELVSTVQYDKAKMDDRLAKVHFKEGGFYQVDEKQLYYCINVSKCCTNATLRQIFYSSKTPPFALGTPTVIDVDKSIITTYKKVYLQVSQQYSLFYPVVVGDDYAMPVNASWSTNAGGTSTSNNEKSLMVWDHVRVVEVGDYSFTVELVDGPRMGKLVNSGCRMVWPRRYIYW